MTTRSGKIYTPYHKKCYNHTCKFYGSQRFKNYCSKCYFNNNPIAFEQFLQKNQNLYKYIYYTKEELEQALNKHQVIDSNNKNAKMIKFIFKNKLNMTNVNYLFNLLSNNYIGITFEFGLELYNVFIKSRNIDPSNKNNDMIIRKMQYFIAGFIADNWNIDCRLGPSTYCYFGHFNPIQKYNENRELIPIESYINPPAFYKKEDQSINRERNHYWTGAISVLLYIENN
jgi:hypothetical protein